MFTVSPVLIYRILVGYTIETWSISPSHKGGRYPKIIGKLFACDYLKETTKNPKIPKDSIRRGQTFGIRLAADLLKMNWVEVVCVQHELGILGGMVFDDVQGFVAAFFTVAQER